MSAPGDVVSTKLDVGPWVGSTDRSCAALALRAAHATSGVMHAHVAAETSGSVAKVVRRQNGNVRL